MGIEIVLGAVAVASSVAGAVSQASAQKKQAKAAKKAAKARAEAGNIQPGVNPAFTIQIIELNGVGCRGDTPVHQVRGHPQETVPAFAAAMLCEQRLTRWQMLDDDAGLPEDGQYGVMYGAAICSAGKFELELLPIAGFLEGCRGLAGNLVAPGTGAPGGAFLTHGLSGNDARRESTLGPIRTGQRVQVN